MMISLSKTYLDGGSIPLTSTTSIKVRDRKANDRYLIQGVTGFDSKLVCLEQYLVAKITGESQYPFGQQLRAVA